MILQTLDELSVVYSVVVSFALAKCVTQSHAKDYTIIGLSSDKSTLVKLGFRWDNRFHVYYYPLCESEICSFKAVSDHYRLVCSSDDGRVYEQRNKSFKDAYEKATFQG